MYVKLMEITKFCIFDSPKIPNMICVLHTTYPMKSIDISLKVPFNTKKIPRKENVL